MYVRMYVLMYEIFSLCMYISNIQIIAVYIYVYKYDARRCMYVSVGMSRYVCTPIFQELANCQPDTTDLAMLTRTMPSA